MQLATEAGRKVNAQALALDTGAEGAPGPVL